MIQRIQTLYLFVALVLLAASFFLRAWLPSLEGMDWPLVGTYIFTGATAALALLSIVSYSDRNRQLSSLRILKWIALAWFAFQIVVIYLYDSLAAIIDGSLPMFYYGVLLIPALIYLLARLSASSVAADIELIKSADRLR